MQKIIEHRFRYLSVVAIMLVSLLLGACGGGSDASSDEEAKTEAPSRAIDLDLELPDSITGGSIASVTTTKSLRGADAGTSMPCAFMGAEIEDPFQNGYLMTQFMVSAVAAWTCLADTVIEVTDLVPHNGEIYEADNDTSQPNYDPDEPTHYQVVDDSDTQTTLRLYYGYDRTSPPEAGEDPQFYLSWNESIEGQVEGRLIIDGIGVNPEDHNPEDPIFARMDFQYDDSQKVADMFLQFDENNQWAEGFRIHVTKDLTAGPLDHMFTALGLIEMKGQFFPTDGISEIPSMHMFTVSDRFGNGAALAEFSDLVLPLELNHSLNNHLGNFLFDKDDIYYFDDDMDWDWIHKTITDARYRGGRTTAVQDGTWVPFDPSLDMIADALELGSDYFTGSQCVDIDDNCVDLLNAVFEDGFADQEPNQGTDPQDWRSDALAAPAYLTTIFPNGVDWSGAFACAFTPAGP